ncbi:MAG: hypothetical protein ACE5M4_15995 [Anaerolineales bacterium]
MTMRTGTGRLITAGLFVSVCVVSLITPGVFAQRRPIILMDGLIRRLDRQSRVIRLWEYTKGDTTWDLQVPGSVNMRPLEVGDFVRVEADGERILALRIRKLKPKENDERFLEAVRRLEAEAGKTQ